MTYYRLDTAEPSEEETGFVWPQVSPSSPAFRVRGDRSFLNLRANRFSDVPLDLDGLELQKKAKPTDMLSMLSVGSEGVKGFLVSQKLKGIFEFFRVAPCRFYPAVVRQQPAFRASYFFMHIVSDLKHYIDFSRTAFYVYELGDDLGPIEINSEEELQATNRRLEGTKVVASHRPVLKKEVVSHYDLFLVPSFTFNTYISGRLKETLVVENVTGISIEPARDIEIV